MGAGSPAEALKAQAVAARTFALKNRGKLAKLDADIDDSTANQTYLGFDAERPSVTAAVQSTSGQVLSYKGELIDAMYGTDCGGMTADGNLPYLSPVADPQCANESAWTVSIPITDFLENLQSVGGVSIPNGIDSITIAKSDDSGRVGMVTIADSKSEQSCTITALQLRIAVGVNKIRSTLFHASIDPTGQNIIFNGHGWGHGLGMCQHGAILLAKNQASYTDILGHYYKNCELTQISATGNNAASPIIEKAQIGSKLTPILVFRKSIPATVAKTVNSTRSTQVHQPKQNPATTIETVPLDL
jgi:stage II sporulation protein D